MQTESNLKKSIHIEIFKYKYLNQYLVVREALFVVEIKYEDQASPLAHHHLIALVFGTSVSLQEKIKIT